MQTYITVIGFLEHKQVCLFLNKLRITTIKTIQDFGAKPENKNNAIYIQKAINMASQEQGRVIIPKGIYKTGTIILKDNITLYLEEGAILKASDDISDFDITKKDNHTRLEVPSFINCDYDGKPTLYFIYGES